MQIIAGKYRGHKISTPKGSNTRPTSSRLREALFNIVQSYIEDTAFLDLYAGSGAMGLEALSRGAKKAAFVDHSKEALQCMQSNAKHLKVEPLVTILNGDVFRMLEKLARSSQFDIIYADAPYSEDDAPSLRLLQFFDESNLLKGDGMLFIEDIQPKHDAELKNLHLISTRNAGTSYLHQYQKGKQ